METEKDSSVAPEDSPETTKEAPVEEPKVEVPDYREELGKLKSEFEQKLDEQQRRFNTLAQQRSARYQSEADKEKRRRESLETQLEALQRQYFESMDSDQKVDYLTQQLEQLKRGQQSIDRQPPPEIPEQSLPSYGDVVVNLLKAQGVSEEELKEVWKVTEGIEDPMRAVQKLGTAVNKLRENRLEQLVQSKVDKIEKSARSKVEKEHEVGDYAPVETGGIPSAKKGKTFTDVEQAYISGDISRAEYTEAMKKFNKGR